MSELPGWLRLTDEEMHVLWVMYEEIEPAPINPSHDDADSYCSLMRMVVDEWAEYIVNQKSTMHLDEDDDELFHATRLERIRIWMQRKMYAEKQVREDNERNARWKAEYEAEAAEMTTHPPNCKCLYHDHPF